ncbi:MAG: GlmU family protein [Bacteroidota bacterium]
MFNGSVILFDHDARNNLLPFAFTRPVCDIRIGILTIREKWEKRFNTKSSSLTQDYLQKKFPTTISDDNLFICGGLIPGKKEMEFVSSLQKGEAISSEGKIIAARVDATDAKKFLTGESLLHLKIKSVNLSERILTQKWQVFKWNDWAIEEDFALITSGRKSAKPSSTNNIISPENIFIEENARMEYVTLNASKGKIYLGKNSEVMEGATIRGALVLCDNSEVKMQAKIYGATTIGPHSKVGGEITNSVIFGYSNKAHDGYLGNSVVGEWCNLGADTNTSNLKNDYSDVKQWNYASQSFENTNQQFCGLMMGDHSKCGINTMFNTGTVVGVSANIFGDGFPRQIISSFSWGGASGFSDYQLNKALKVAKLVMQRRNLELTTTDIEILTHIYNLKER